MMPSVVGLCGNNGLVVCVTKAQQAGVLFVTSWDSDWGAPAAIDEFWQRKNKGLGESVEHGDSLFFLYDEKVTIL